MQREQLHLPWSVTGKSDPSFVTPKFLKLCGYCGSLHDVCRERDDPTVVVYMELTFSKLILLSAYSTIIICH